MKMFLKTPTGRPKADRKTNKPPISVCVNMELDGIVLKHSRNHMFIRFSGLNDKTKKSIKFEDDSHIA